MCSSLSTTGWFGGQNNTKHG
ncbi:hypothetical protein D041_0550A, partial [Vibrio parahaemolyticus EKP-008]